MTTDIRRTDVRSYNRHAWNQQTQQGNPWTVPVSPEMIAAAQRGEWSVGLTPTKPVPAEWFPEFENLDVLCLACGGGQQGPIFAAAGARVTVFDNSPAQLAGDRLVAEREKLALTLVEGDMVDLSIFQDSSFDLIFHPVSNCFSVVVLTVWQECFRVLRPGGLLLAGFVNPDNYIFDYDRLERQGILEVRYPLPFSDLEHLPEDQLAERLASGFPLEFSHSLSEQIGGQLAAGFLLTDLYEDKDNAPGDPIDNYIWKYIATCAIKPIEE